MFRGNRKVGAVLAIAFAAVFATIYNIYGGIFGGDVYAGSLTVTVSDDSADLNLVAAEGGVAYGESDTASFSISTTSSGGYTATITGGNSTGRLTGTDSSNYFSSIASTTASPANFNNGTWGFKPSTYNSSSNTSYQPVVTSSDVATLDVTNSAMTGNYTLAVAAKTDTDTAPDTYSYNFVVAATSNAIDYDIAFVNPGDSMPARMTSSTTGSTVTLPNDTPTMDGYTFAGWCTVSVSPGSACTGTTYAAGASYTLDSSSANNVTLYAIWELPPNLFGISTMQEMTSTICANTTTPLASATALDTDGSHDGDTSYVPSKTLTDTRGGSYVVRKLADGNCWMVQNLNLTLTSGQNLTNADTDLNTKSSWNPGTSTSSSVPSNSTTSSTSYTRGNKWCSGTGNNANQTCNTTDTGDQTNHIGILYNWYAATAGSGTSDLASSSATNTTDATDSICPKGWRLPTGGDSSKTNTNGKKYSFNNLLTTTYSVASSAAGSVKMRSSPLSFIFSGYYDGGSLYSEGSSGYYWSSSAYTSSSYAYSMYFSKSSVYPQNYYDKYNGFSVRCVAK